MRGWIIHSLLILLVFTEGYTKVYLFCVESISVVLGYVVKAVVSSNNVRWLNNLLYELLGFHLIQFRPFDLRYTGVICSFSVTQCCYTIYIYFTLANESSFHLSKIEMWYILLIVWCSITLSDWRMRVLSTGYMFFVDNTSSSHV